MDYETHSLKQSTFAKRERSEKSTGFAPVGGEDMSRLRCPLCGVPTIEDVNEDTVEDELYCNQCEKERVALIEAQADQARRDNPQMAKNLDYWLGRK